MKVKQDEDIVNNYKSFGDNGLLEPKQEYRKTEVNEPQFQVVSPIGGKYEKVKEHPNARPIIDTITRPFVGEIRVLEVITDKEKINDALKGHGWEGL